MRDDNAIAGVARAGFECAPICALEDWATLASAWHAWLERTIARCDGLDAPFCHSEHGCMHSFMAAAESVGWSTLREVPHHVMAWSFPQAVHGLRYRDRHYGGVVMLATLVETAPAAAPG